MDSWLPIMTIILVIIIIIFIVVAISLYFTGVIHIAGPTGPAGVQGVPGNATHTGATGPRGLIGLTGQQGIRGPTGQIGPTGKSGLNDFAFVSFSQNSSMGELELGSNSNMIFNQADVHGNITFINNDTLVLGDVGFYQVSFGFSNIKPGEFVTQSFSLIVNGGAAQPFYTLQEQINLTSSTTILRYDRGGLSSSVIIGTTVPNETLQLRNTLNHPISFLNETSPVTTTGNLGSLSAYISVIKLL